MASSESRTENVARRFCDCTLPLEEWSHEAHLRVGLWHLLHHVPDEAMDLLRVRIRAFNAACGIPNTDTSGYHETITRFFVALIAEFLERHDRGRPLDELTEDLLHECGDRHLPFRYYTKERLTSRRARHHWVEPDLAPLPATGRS